MTHGHDLKGGNVGGRGCAGWRGVKGGKWDNCNSIINKIHLKKQPLLNVKSKTLPMTKYFLYPKNIK